MTSQEWFALPWWEAEALLDGLRSEEIIGGGEQRTPANASPSTTMDVTAAPLETLSGFTTRRAG